MIDISQEVFQFFPFVRFETLRFYLVSDFKSLHSEVIQKSDFLEQWYHALECLDLHIFGNGLSLGV